MAYKMISVSTGTITKTTDGKAEIMVQSESDLDHLPEDVSTGSVAYTADLEHLWIKDVDGSWKEATANA